MQAVDTLLKARWVIPVEPRHAVLEKHTLVIDRGRVLDLLPTALATGAYTAKHTAELDAHILIPGLINSHTHAAMSLFRGLADDLPLMTWLNGHMWPAEARWVSETFVYDGTLLAAAEMLRGGTTCFNDMYFYPEVAGRAASNAGMRACVGLILIDFPTVYAASANEYLSKGLMVHDQFKGDNLVITAFAPHAPYTVADGPLTRMRTYADELGLSVHMHVHETADEIERSIAEHGMRPMERLVQLGLVSPALLAVHMTQANDTDIQELAAAGANVVHCPESNLKLASGLCPAQSMIDAGVNVALGTDGAASNNDLDMFGEMRTAALLAKAVAKDATAVPAASALRMATLDGAAALGLADEIGSLEIGKSADVVAVRMDAIENLPMYDPISQLVYTAGRERVTDVWIAGRRVLKDRCLTTVDEEALAAKAHTWNARIRDFKA